jgi:hypothetical protein
MKRNALTTVMTIAMVAPAAVAGHKAQVVGPVVAICLEEPLEPKYALAPGTTNAIFAAIGIKLEWHGYQHCPAGGIRISLATSTPADFHPGALAYAMPHEGTHIVVLFDRIRANIEEHKILVVLGHVYAHEITHILQGCSRHSESGLMKAHWDAHELSQMAWHPLPFTADDILLIRLGVKYRAASAGLPEYHGETERPGTPR